jgi:hypothetical protein
MACRSSGEDMRPALVTLVSIAVVAAVWLVTREGSAPVDDAPPVADGSLPQSEVTPLPTPPAEAGPESIAVPFGVRVPAIRLVACHPTVLPSENRSSERRLGDPFDPFGGGYVPPAPGETGPALRRVPGRAAFDFAPDTVYADGDTFTAPDGRDYELISVAEHTVFHGRAAMSVTVPVAMVRDVVSGRRDAVLPAWAPPPNGGLTLTKPPASGADGLAGPVVWFAHETGRPRQVGDVVTAPTGERFVIRAIEPGGVSASLDAVGSAGGRLRRVAITPAPAPHRAGLVIADLDAAAGQWVRFAHDPTPLRAGAEVTAPGGRRYSVVAITPTAGRIERSLSARLVHSAPLWTAPNAEPVTVVVAGPAVTVLDHETGREVDLAFVPVRTTRLPLRFASR